MFSMEVTRLIERCRQGDADALGELYEAYAQKMRGVCRRYISDEQAISDVLHDSFVIIFTSFDKLRDDRKAEAWMMSITRNVASKYKDHLAKMTFVQLEEAEHLQTPEGAGEVRGVPLEDVQHLVDRLPEGYGQVFRLSVFEGMSHKEIADTLGIEPHSSSSQLARAKKMLRQMMQQYWVAALLLLLVPITFNLFKTSVKDEDSGGKPSPVVVKKKDTPKESPKDSRAKDDGEDQPADGEHLTSSEKPVISLIAQNVDTITEDTLAHIVAQEQATTDTVSGDTTTTIHEVELPQYDIADLFSEKSTVSTDNEKRWSLQLAYAGQIDEQNRYNQPFSLKPAPSDGQSVPGPFPSTIIPDHIDNWTDYAIYLANNPDAVSDKTRSIIMHIALNNANRPGEDMILRTSHHQMPVTWSLAFKYKLNHRFGLETGLSYSRLTSDFELGADGRSATEGDACLGNNTIREQQAIHYLGIPIKGIYNLYGGRRWGLYGSLGVTTEIPVRSTLHSDFYVNGQYEAGDKTTIRAPWQFSTTLGLGLQYDVTPYIGLFAEPSLQYYIPTGTQIETYRTEHPFTFSLPLGIRFTW